MDNLQSYPNWFVYLFRAKGAADRWPKIVNGHFLFSLAVFEMFLHRLINVFAIQKTLKNSAFFIFQCLFDVSEMFLKEFHFSGKNLENVRRCFSVVSLIREKLTKENGFTVLFSDEKSMFISA